MEAIVKINNIEHRAERLLLYSLTLTFFLLGGLYIYFLSSSVAHVVISKELDEKINRIHGDIAALEATYMEKQQAISLEVAKTHGYVLSQAKVFIDRSHVSVVTTR